MPSSNKTPLGLNQWIGTDKPKKDDFNADNLITDAALAGKANAELGTWTPRIIGYTSGEVLGYTTLYGEYAIIGNMAHVWAKCYITGAGDAIGYIGCTLPIAARNYGNTINPLGTSLVNNLTGIASAYTSPVAMISAPTFVRFDIQNINGSSYQIAPSNLTSSSKFFFYVSYKI